MTDAIPKLEYTETEAGIRQVATRGPGNLRISDWSFPNANHILTPGRTKDAAWVHRGVWSVPVDDTHTYKGIYAIASVSPEEDRATVEHFEKYGDYNPADHHDELFLEKKWPQDPSLQLTPAQDYVAMMGQGSIVEGTREHLGKSDLGIALLRKIFWREMEALRNGHPTKQWRRLEHAQEMPVPGRRQAAPA